MKKMKFMFLCGAIGTAILAGSTSKAVNFYDTIGTKYEGAAERLAELEVISGTSKGVFSPNKPVTRAEFAKMISKCAYNKAEYNALSSDNSAFWFNDVDKTAWYNEYVTVAINGGLMSGYEDHTFKPDQEISYSEIAKMTTRALGHVYLVETDPRGWDAEYVDKAYEEGLFRYVTFKSTAEKATRGDVANILWNMLKADKWKMIERSDAAGFTYVNTGFSLFDTKIIDHRYLLNAKIQGYYEFNGKKYVQINGAYYKIFDQSAKVDFSTIGGTSDVLFKRVEYPGEIVRYEVIGISTDIGSQLYAGTYEELTGDNFRLINKSKLSPDADYAYLYHYDEDPERDRAISINLSKTYVVDEIKIDDGKIEEEKTEDDEDEEKKKTHSYTANQFVKDEIAYRYDKEDEQFYRTITINEDEAIILDGSVLFKDNEMVDWKTVKKGDVIIEITPNRYYFIQTDNDKFEATLLAYSNKKDDYWIETSEGKYATYETTRFQDYLTNKFRKFNSLKKDELDNMIDRNIRITTDISERVIRIELLSDDITNSELNLGFFDSYLEQENGSSVVRLWIDGKVKFFYTSLKSISARRGDFVKFEFESGSTKNIKSVSVITNTAKITDKMNVESIALDKLVDKLKYFDDDELEILKSTFIYSFAKYDEPSSYEIETVNIEDVKSLPLDEGIECYLLIDGEGVIRKVYITDNRGINDIYYGIVTKIYRDKESKKDFVKVKMVGGKDKTYEYTNMLNCVEGDFIKYKLDKETITIEETFEAKDLGYYKDFIVKSEDKEDKKVVGYKLKDGSYINLADWTIESDEIIKLKNFEVFLVTVEKNASREWKMTSALRITSDKPDFAAGDRIAINEIEGTAVVYRGYK